MTQPGFDLGPPEMPLLKKCRNLMNGSMFIFMKTWTDFFILDNTGIFCPENMVVLLQVAAQDGSCSTCMGFFKYLFCCLTSDISLLFLSSWCSTDLADSVWFVWVVWLNSVFTGGACLVFIGQFMSDFFFPLLLPKSFVFCSSSC